jgi:benzoylformate decarboxylase
VRKVFGNRGSTEMPFLADFPGDIDYVLGLHEGAVVRMADVYAQLTGERTLVNLHTAVGLGNAMVAIINAASGHSPLVITAGQQVRATLTMQPLLANTDPTMLPRPAVKWAFEPPRAQDVLNALAKRLTAARNPVLVVGAGLDTAAGGFEAGVALAERQNLPVWLAPNTSRVGFPTEHAHFRGSIPAGIAWLSESLAGHDLILVAGAPVLRYYPYVPGSYLPSGAELVAIVDDPDAAARAPVGDAMIADPALAVARARTACTAGDPARSRHAHRIPGLQHRWAADRSQRHRRDRIDERCCRHVGPDEVPPFGFVLLRCRRRPRVRRTGGGGCPARPTRAAGAGGERRRPCAVRHPRVVHRGQPRASVTFLILVNREYGILKGFGDYLTTTGAPGLDLEYLDYESLAKGHGIPAVRTGGPDEMAIALKQAFTAGNGPHMIIVDIAPGVRLGG